MIGLLFLLSSVRCDEVNDDDSFWNELSDDQIVVEDKVPGKLYDKARFNLPIARRLNSLFPETAKAVRDLQDVVNIEFVYEEKFPILYFLDSQDVIIEKIELAKKSRDEIKSILVSRNFDLNLKKPPETSAPKPVEETNSTNETSTPEPQAEEAGKTQEI